MEVVRGDSADPSVNWEFDETLGWLSGELMGVEADEYFKSGGI
jgi:hypothetical protein